jgi:hypothetical protein
MTVALTDEIKRLFLELQGKNVAFQPLKTQAWGARLHYQRPGRKPASVRGPRQVARAVWERQAACHRATWRFDFRLGVTIRRWEPAVSAAKVISAAPKKYFRQLRLPK